MTTYDPNTATAEETNARIDEIARRDIARWVVCGGTEMIRTNLNMEIRRGHMNPIRRAIIEEGLKAFEALDRLN